MSTKRERLFADELASQDSHFAAENGIACVQNFYSGSTFDEQQLLGSDQKRNPQVVL